MAGDDKEMLTRHDRQIKEDIFPWLKRLDDSQEVLSRQQQSNENALEKFKIKLESFELSQQDLKNEVVKYGQNNVVMLNKVLDHSLGIKEKQEEMKGSLDKANAVSKERITIAKLSTREKIIASLIGVGGISGLLIAVGQAVESIVKYFK